MLTLNIHVTFFTNFSFPCWEINIHLFGRIPYMCRKDSLLWKQPQVYQAVNNIFSKQYRYIIKRNGYENLWYDHQTESALIFYQILLTYSSKWCSRSLIIPLQTFRRSVQQANITACSSTSISVINIQLKLANWYTSIHSPNRFKQQWFWALLYHLKW